MTTEATPDILAAIVAATRARVDAAKARESWGALERRALLRAPEGAAFRDAVSRTGRINVIAECKRRSPSRGVLRAAYEPVTIARGYERAGAAAVSVLTEPGFFDGALAHLAAVADAVSVPCLRKDFIIDEYQVLEARAAGADAVLLIVAAISDVELRHLGWTVAQLGMAALVEVHDMAECDRALEAGEKILGVNNRNLRTLEVDVEASRVVAERLPADVVAISESGLRTPEDLRALRHLGYRAFLIGERFMTRPDPGAALGEFLREAAEGPGARAS